MMVIILGENRAELNKIRRKDEDKHFFQSRKQAYKMYPNGFQRMRIIVNGITLESEEVIVYRENAIAPHAKDAMNVCYKQDRIMAEMTTHKVMAEKGLFNKRSIWGSAVSEVWKPIGQYLPVIIVMIILAWALATR